MVQNNYMMLNQYKSVLLVIVLSAIQITQLYGQTAIKARLEQILADSLLKQAHVGVSIRDVKSTNLIFEKNANLSFTPASNLKLLTTAAALSILGADYRFVTSVMYTDSIQDGVFNGTLLIKGGGDPTLGSDKIPGQTNYQTLIHNWVVAFKAKGIHTFSGVLKIDATHFEFNSTPKDYTWGDIGNYYGAGSFGVNINDNQYILMVKPGSAVGAPTSVVGMIPFDTASFLDNHIKTGAVGTGDQSVIYTAPYSKYIFAEGTIPMGSTYSVKGSIPEPSRLLGQLLIEEMVKQGIVWKGVLNLYGMNEAERIQQDFVVLIEHTSPTIKEIASYTNLVSNNLYAECLLKELSYRKTGVGATELGVSQVKRFVKSMGTDTLGMVLRDGSGMSPFNSISPNQFTLFLSKLYSNKVFVSSIPVAGIDGTVSHICKASNGKVRVKSGTMSGVTCYSGYVLSNSGTQYAVSLLVNKHEAKNRSIQRVLEKLLMALIEN
jgi:serine-type D-Ala-D-Ala carboxypeptidase/endopeptidase (penicillin-binding protein 4)